MNPIPLPAPYAGVNELVPKIAIESPFCEELFNFNVTQEGITLRHGDSKYATVSAIAPSRLESDFIFKYGDSTLFIVIRDYFPAGIRIYNVTTATTAYTPGITTNDNFTSLYFNKYLFLFGYNFHSPGYVYDGAAWGVIGYTGSGTFRPYGGNVYNNRAYLLQATEAAYWYSNINAISGAMTKVDLSSITEQKCTLSAIASFTIAETVQAVTYQTFIFDNGEILFYSGSYPNGPDWTLVGKAKIGQPLDYNSVFQYQGDSIVLCDTGVVSLRDLFLKGSQQGKGLSINDRIQTTWANLIQAYRVAYSNPVGPIIFASTGSVKGIWDPKTDRIIISFPFYLDSTGTIQFGSFYFIFNTQLTSWYTQRSYGCLGTTVINSIDFSNKVLTLCSSNDQTKIMIYEKEGSTGFTDRNPNDTVDVPYDFETISAPIANGRNYVQKATGLDVIVKSDLYAQTNYQLIKDFGVVTSNAQKTDAPTGTLQKPFVNMGIEGSYIQYKISGTTTTGKTVGIELYGANLWIDQGASPR